MDIQRPKVHESHWRDHEGGYAVGLAALFERLGRANDDFSDLDERRREIARVAIALNLHFGYMLTAIERACDEHEEWTWKRARELEVQIDELKGRVPAEWPPRGAPTLADSLPGRN